MRFKLTVGMIIMSFISFAQTKSILEVKQPDVIGLHFVKAGESFKAAGAFALAGIIVSQVFTKKDPKVAKIVGYSLGGLGMALTIKGGFHLTLAGNQMIKKPK